jgi:hypothetical protein
MPWMKLDVEEQKVRFVVAGRVAQTTRGCPIQSRSVRLSGVAMLPAIPHLPFVRHRLYPAVDLA